MMKMNNMTCVLREMHCLDDDNNIDIKAMKEDAENYKVLRYCLIEIFSDRLF